MARFGSTGVPPPPTPGNTLAVVVTYHPEGALVQNVRAALAHAHRVLIVDNTPTPHSPRPVEEAGALPGVEVLRMGRNVGVAAALNRGLEALRAGGHAWLLSLDQDTLLFQDYGEITRTAVEAAGPRLGLLGVNFEIGGTPAVLAGPGAREQETVITSGTLLSAACARATGAFREDYFIDAVDVEYALRARQVGFSVWLAFTVGMEHDLGRVTEHHFLGRRRRTFNYPPLRLYFIARNGLVTIRDYRKTEPDWSRSEAKRMFYTLAKAVALERDKLAKVTALMRGLADGVRGRMGHREARS